MRQRQSSAEPDAGFTLLELLVGMMLLGIVTAMATPPLRNYQRAIDGQGASRDVLSTLRNAQERAVSEARTHCVEFTTTGARHTYKLGRPSNPGAAVLDCGVTLSGPHTMRSETSFASVVFTSASASNIAFFTARGSATAGTAVIQRNGSDKRYTISVEGLTARVSSTS